VDGTEENTIPYAMLNTLCTTRYGNRT